MNAIEKLRSMITITNFVLTEISMIQQIHKFESMLRYTGYFTNYSHTMRI